MADTLKSWNHNGCDCVNDFVLKTIQSDLKEEVKLRLVTETRREGWTAVDYVVSIDYAETVLYSDFQVGDFNNFDKGALRKIISDDLSKFKRLNEKVFSKEHENYIFSGFICKYPSQIQYLFDTMKHEIYWGWTVQYIKEIRDFLGENTSFKEVYSQCMENFPSSSLGRYSENSP